MRNDKKEKDVTCGTAADRHIRSNLVPLPWNRLTLICRQTSFPQYILNSNVDIANPKSFLLFYYQLLKFIERKRWFETVDQLMLHVTSSHDNDVHRVISVLVCYPRPFAILGAGKTSEQFSGRVLQCEYVSRF